MRANAYFCVTQHYRLSIEIPEDDLGEIVNVATATTLSDLESAGCLVGDPSLVVSGVERLDVPPPAPVDNR